MRWVPAGRERVSAPTATVLAEVEMRTRCTPEASASIDGLNGVEQLIEQGLFKREYRDHRLEWMIKSGGLQVVIDGIAKDNIRFTPDFD